MSPESLSGAKLVVSIEKNNETIIVAGLRLRQVFIGTR
jgi:hypothetical protein